MPADEVEQELDSLKAQDSTFNALVDQTTQLNGRKEAVSESLARMLQTVSDSMNRITTDYATADSLDKQLDNLD